MKIISFKAENFKRLVSVEITPKGNVVKITGKNAEGKSSILDAIWCACGGKDVAPERPIRAGEDNATIELDLGELKVKRRFTAGGSTLTVENAEGAVFRSPQKVLDELIGKLSFDPMNFMHMSDKDQFETLAKYAGVDFTELDAERKQLFEDRTIVNRNGKAKRAEVDAAALVLDDDAPDEEVSVVDLANQLNKANENNRMIEGLERTVEEQCKEIRHVESEIQNLKTRLSEAKSKKEKFEENIKTQTKIDVSELQTKIDNAEETNKAVRSKKAYYQKNDELEILLTDSKALTNNIENIDAKREKLIADSDLPVDGLSFGEDVVLFDDIPIKQASSAEQLKISTAVAMSMNPKLKVIRVQDGSLLDSDSMSHLEKVAKDKDFQFWVEQVDESGLVGVVIEDGSVKADNQ